MSQLRYTNLEQRLLLNSIMVPAMGCWLWLGRCTPDGYPLINFRLNGKHITRRAHRVSFELLGGAMLEPGTELDHICHNRACINPDHLVQVTKATNLANRRGYKSNGRK